MNEIIKKMNELKDLIKKHSEIISVSISNIRDVESDILVNGFKEVPTEAGVNYQKLSKNIGGWQKSIVKDGVKILAYGTAENVKGELEEEND